MGIFDIAIGHHKAGRLDDAAMLYGKMLEDDAGNFDALHMMGLIRHQVGDDEGALGLMERAVNVKGDYAPCWNNMGSVLFNLGRVDEAVAAFRKAIGLRKGFAEAWSNLGNALVWEGDVAGSLEAYRTAIGLCDYPDAHSALLFVMNYVAGVTRQDLYREACVWAKRYIEPTKSLYSPRQAGRNNKIRIGYVSPDLHNHVVARALLPLLERHDRKAFEIYAYADVVRPDEMTQKLFGLTDHWCNIAGMPDSVCAAVIQRDGVDILVDLSGHSARNRLLVFARQPAPIQVTWLGYPGTTGMRAMQYRITDEFDPSGAEDCSEKLMRVKVASCYRPHLADPGLVDPPCLRNGYVTFGCLSKACKVTNGALVLWRGILDAMPTSKMVLYALEGAGRAKLLQRLGVDESRVSFVGHGGKDYLAIYNRIDIVLDTFPYTGSTTTCDDLWMGVPVVTLTGQTPVSRMSHAILTHIGHPEFIATTPEQYHNIALLAARVTPLVSLRRTLRIELQQSPVMDEAGFVQGMEAAYRHMLNG